MSLRKKRMICPRLPGLSAMCHCRIGARCHDRRVHQMSILITATYPLKSTAEISFGSLGKIKSQTSSSSMRFYQELRIWRRVAPGSTTKIPSGLWASGKSKLKFSFSPSLSSEALDLAPRVHLNRTTETYSRPSGFGCFESET
jgi:hypothetical protein